MPFARDTRPGARAQVLARLRAMSPTQRGVETAGMVQAGLALARLEPDGRAPDPADARARARFLRRWLGRGLAEVVIAELRRRMRDPV